MFTLMLVIEKKIKMSCIAFIEMLSPMQKNLWHNTIGIFAVVA
jgi:hypothetical protein